MKMQCRACAKTKCKILVDMRVVCTDDDKCLFDCFNACTQLQASPKDSFPKTLCKICAQKLQIAYSFRKCAQQSEELFSKHLNSQRMNTEPIILPINENLAFKENITTDDPMEMGLKSVKVEVEEDFCAGSIIVKAEEMEPSPSPVAIKTNSMYNELLCVVSEDTPSDVEEVSYSNAPENHDDFYSGEFLEEIEELEWHENPEDIIKPLDENIYENELLSLKANNKSQRLVLNESNSVKSLEEEQKSEDELVEKVRYPCETKQQSGDNYSVQMSVDKRKKIKEPKQKKRKLTKGEVDQETVGTGDKQQEVQKTNTNNERDLHNVEKKHKHLCSFCPRVLSSKQSLKAHERKHLKLDIKECPMCQKKYREEYLKKHILAVHTGERKFTCDICGDSYKTQQLLGRHKLLHIKERPLACIVCDKRFTEKSHIKVHMRIHTGEMPFACDLCGRRFRIRVHLTYHLKKHANIKYKCEVCGKEFKISKSLKDHSYVHTGLMPYSCTICDYGSPKREYFVKHLMSKHQTSMTADELFAMFKANTGRSPHVKLAEDMEMLKRKVQPKNVSTKCS